MFIDPWLSSLACTVEITLDTSFKILDGELTDEQQKDFYIALQEWQQVSQGTSDSTGFETYQIEELPLSSESTTSSDQLGESWGTGGHLRREWIAFVESTQRSEEGIVQATDIQDALFRGGADVDSMQGGSGLMDRIRASRLPW